jgi:hypothetical protein
VEAVMEEGAVEAMVECRAGKSGRESRMREGRPGEAAAAKMRAAAHAPDMHAAAHAMHSATHAAVHAAVHTTSHSTAAATATSERR